MDKIDSILTYVKKLHGISESDTSFDPDMIIHINSALMAVNQLGIGPVTGFYIEDNLAVWGDFIPDKVIAEAIKSLVYIKVRLRFDPPASQTVVDALKESAEEDTWRIKEWVENNSYV